MREVDAVPGLIRALVTSGSRTDGRVPWHTGRTAPAVFARCLATGTRPVLADSAPVVSSRDTCMPCMHAPASPFETLVPVMLVRERHSRRITQWTLCRVRAHMHGAPNHRRARRMQLVGPLLSEEEQPDKFEDYVAPEVDPAGDAAAPDAAAPAAAVAPPQVTRVATAPQLIKAVAAGDRDILITDHIDLSNLPTDDLGFIMAVLPTTRSIRVRAETKSQP